MIDLARAYKALKSKQTQLEGIIIQHSPIKSLSQPNDFLGLESYLKIALSNQDAGNELAKLAQQISTLKHSHNEELQNALDMYHVVQQKLMEREEVFSIYSGN